MRNMSEAETKVRIAKRVAEMLPDGGFVNLGVGIPTMAVDYLPANKHIYIQTENGMLGVGPKQLSGEAIIPNLINASRTPVTETPGCCYFDSATSFAMIRSGRMDATVIGAIQINEAGDLANWALPGKGVLGPGGAMDLVVGVKEVIVATSHTAKNGRHKLVKDCTVPLTGRKVVNTLVTEYAVFKFKDGMMFFQKSLLAGLFILLAITAPAAHSAVSNADKTNGHTAASGAVYLSLIWSVETSRLHPVAGAQRFLSTPAPCGLLRYEQGNDHEPDGFFSHPACVHPRCSPRRPGPEMDVGSHWRTGRERAGAGRHPGDAKPGTGGS